MIIGCPTEIKAQEGRVGVTPAMVYAFEKAGHRVLIQTGAGLGSGYVWARKLAETIRALDPSRPVSNAICSFWNGLDDQLQAEQQELRDLVQYSE